MFSFDSLQHTQDLFAKIIYAVKYLFPIGITAYLYFYVRKSKFYFIKERAIKLYDEVVKDIEGISITFDEQEIQQSLILFRGTVILKGHTDIRKDEIDKEIVIYSPDKTANWKNFEIVNSSVDFNPKYSIEDNKIVMSKSMLKANDYFTFVGLLDSKATELSVGHRIFNLRPGSINLSESDFVWYKQLAIGLSILIALLLWYNIRSDLETTRIQKAQEIQDASVRERSKKDSLDNLKYNLESNYYIYGKKVDIELLDNVRSSKNKPIFKRRMDSLTKKIGILKIKFDKNPSERNELLMYKSAFDAMVITNDNAINDYGLIKYNSSLLVDSLIKSNSLVAKKSFKINDSTQVIYTIPKHTKLDYILKEPELTILDHFMSFLVYAFVILVIVVDIRSIYYWISLGRLRKIYKDK